MIDFYGTFSCHVLVLWILLSKLQRTTFNYLPCIFSSWKFNLRPLPFSSFSSFGVAFAMRKISLLSMLLVSCSFGCSWCLNRQRSSKRHLLPIFQNRQILSNLIREGRGGGADGRGRGGGDGGGGGPRTWRRWLLGDLLREKDWEDDILQARNKQISNLHAHHRTLPKIHQNYLYSAGYIAPGWTKNFLQDFEFHLTATATATAAATCFSRTLWKCNCNSNGDMTEVYANATATATLLKEDHNSMFSSWTKPLQLWFIWIPYIAVYELYIKKGRVLQNCCRGSWTQGWVSATEAGLKAAAVAVAVLSLA